MTFPAFDDYMRAAFIFSSWRLGALAAHFPVPCREV
jgi:hypothetical protein